MREGLPACVVRVYISAKATGGYRSYLKEKGEPSFLR